MDLQIFDIFWMHVSEELPIVATALVKSTISFLQPWYSSIRLLHIPKATIDSNGGSATALDLYLQRWILELR